jgi:hypothetical protein
MSSEPTGSDRVDPRPTGQIVGAVAIVTIDLGVSIVVRAVLTARFAHLADSAIGPRLAETLGVPAVDQPVEVVVELVVADFIQQAITGDISEAGEIVAVDLAVATGKRQLQLGWSPERREVRSGSIFPR